MKFTEKFEKAFRLLLPAPFTIAVILTLLTMGLALAFGSFPNESKPILQLLDFWQEGLWNAPMLAFAVQMMLILVLGHILALAKPIGYFIDTIIGLAKSAAMATLLVGLCTMMVGLFNWGLGLIFGAIMARKTAEKFSREGKSINYPLLGAAGYAGMMVWHGGLSGSAPLKVVEEGHISQIMTGIFTEENILETISIPLESTIFSPMNLTATFLLLSIIPLFLALMANRTKGNSAISNLKLTKTETTTPLNLIGAEKLDYSKFLCIGFGLLILGYALTVPSRSANGLSFLNLNYINLVLLGLCLVFHARFSNFLKALDEAIKGSSGILIQFPLYFGIMGIMRSTGLIQLISDYFISISTVQTFPIFTLISAGLVNIFVPSGGGQWAVQGPIILQAADQLGVSFSKSVMALAYGDQLTNMLQPFWALPLLGITGLKAKEILPYTLSLMLIGTLIFTTVLLLF